MPSSLHTQLSECRSVLARERDSLTAARANVATLRAENARLRAALETLVTACDERGGRIRTVHRVDVDTARAALAGTPR